MSRKGVCEQFNQVLGSYVCLVEYTTYMPIWLTVYTVTFLYSAFITD